MVFFLKSFFNFVVSDRPKKLTAQIKREYYVVQNMLMQAEKDDILNKYGKADIENSVEFHTRQYHRST